jgi:hypothetical protein
VWQLIGYLLPNNFSQFLNAGFVRGREEQGCERVSLASGFPRTDAHRFYEERMGYERVSFVFTKGL